MNIYLSIINVLIFILFRRGYSGNGNYRGGAGSQPNEENPYAELMQDERLKVIC